MVEGFAKGVKYALFFANVIIFVSTKECKYLIEETLLKYIQLIYLQYLF